MDLDQRMETCERVMAILREHGIRMAVGGCGCCGSPWVSFWYNGEQILDSEDYASFDMGREPSKHFKRVESIIRTGIHTEQEKE